MLLVRYPRTRGRPIPSHPTSRRRSIRRLVDVRRRPRLRPGCSSRLSRLHRRTSRQSRRNLRMSRRSHRTHRSWNRRSHRSWNRRSPRCQGYRRYRHCYNRRMRRLLPVRKSQEKYGYSCRKAWHAGARPTIDKIEQAANIHSSADTTLAATRPREAKTQVVHRPSVRLRSPSVARESRRKPWRLPARRLPARSVRREPTPIHRRSQPARYHRL